MEGYKGYEEGGIVPHADIVNSYSSSVVSLEKLALWKSTFNKVVSPIVLINKTGQILLTNESWDALITQWIKGRILVLNYFDLLVELCGEKAYSFINHLKELALIPTRVVEEQLFWKIGNSQLSFIIRGKVFGEDADLIILEHVDISEKEKQLDSSKNLLAMYRSMFEHLPFQFFRKDLHGRITYANRHFCQAVGRHLEELIGLTEQELFPEKAQVILEEDNQVINGHKEIETIEQINYDSNTAPFYYYKIKSPVFDAKGQIVGIQTIRIDITQRKRTYQYVKELVEALDAAKEAIIVCGIDGGIRYLNKMARGLCTDEYKRYGHKIWEVLGIDYDNAISIINEVIQNGYWDGYLNYKSKMNTESFCHSRWIAIRDRGAACKSLLVILF